MEVADHLDVARSTAHRLLSALMVRGFVVQDSHKVYRSGPTIEHLQRPRGTARTLTEVVRPHLESLAGTLGETCHIGVLEGNGARFIMGIPGPRSQHLGNRTGMLLPAHRTAIGRALLAELPPPTLRALYPRGVTGDAREARSTLLDLERQVRAVREAGYSRNEGESDAGVNAFGMCLRDGSGRSVAAMAVAIPTTRFDRAMIPDLVTRIGDTVRACGKDLANG